MQESMYCMLCQDDHQTSALCLVNVECKGCGKRGHVRKDCPGSSPRKRQRSNEGPLGSPGRKVAKLSQTHVSDITGTDISVSAVNKIVEAGNTTSFQEAVNVGDISDDEDGEIREENNNSLSGTTFTADKCARTRLNTKLVQENNAHNLNPGHYTIVSVHVELLRTSKDSLPSLTQIGCVVHGSDHTFFRGIKPSGLEEFLDSYKLGGDLLQALHMTREDDGSFLFRKLFEVVEKSSKIVCVEESEALQSLRCFLQKYSNTVLLGVDEDTLAILVDKLRTIDKEESTIVGFTYWKRVLKYLDVEDYKGVDLEDYCGEVLVGHSSALDIAEVLLKVADDISSKKKNGRKSMESGFYKLCKNIDSIRKPEQNKSTEEPGVESLEVYNSFTRSLSATIRAERIEQIDVSSESDSDSAEVGGNLADHALVPLTGGRWQVALAWQRRSRLAGQTVAPTSASQTTTLKVQSSLNEMVDIPKWKIGEFGEGFHGVLCPWCNNEKVLVSFINICNHIARLHSEKRLTNSRLCPICDKAVLPSEIPDHLPTCISLVTPTGGLLSALKRESQVAGQAAASTSTSHRRPAKIQFQYWMIRKIREGVHGVRCPWCPPNTRVLVHFKNIHDHVVKVHYSKFVKTDSEEFIDPSLLCPVCNTEVMSSQVLAHMPTCAVSYAAAKPPPHSSSSPHSERSTQLKHPLITHQGQELEVRPPTFAQPKSTPEPLQEAAAPPPTLKGDNDADSVVDSSSSRRNSTQKTLRSMRSRSRNRSPRSSSRRSRSPSRSGTGITRGSRYRSRSRSKRSRSRRSRSRRSRSRSRRSRSRRSRSRRSRSRRSRSRRSRSRRSRSRRSRSRRSRRSRNKRSSSRDRRSKSRRRRSRSKDERSCSRNREFKRHYTRKARSQSKDRRFRTRESSPRRTVISNTPTMQPPVESEVMLMKSEEPRRNRTIAGIESDFNKMWSAEVIEKFGFGTKEKSMKVCKEILNYVINCVCINTGRTGPG